MGVLAWAVSTTAKQAVLMTVLASLPGMWWNYSGLGEMSEQEKEDPAVFATAHVLLSLGLAFVVAGLAYKALPIDLIPNCIPLVGKLDDMAAGLLAGVGLAVMWAGWTYGTGPKPPEAIAAATQISAAYAFSEPARTALVAALKAGYKVGAPAAAAAAPAVEMAWARVRPGVEAVRRKVLGSALEEYAAQVEAHNTPLMTNLRWFKKLAANALKSAADGWEARLGEGKGKGAARPTKK